VHVYLDVITIEGINRINDNQNQINYNLIRRVKILFLSESMKEVFRLFKIFCNLFVI